MKTKAKKQNRAWETDDTQKRIDALVWNVGNAALTPERLKAAGLTEKDATDKRKALALERAEERVKEALKDNKTINWRAPFDRETELGVHTVWLTACGRYKVTKRVSKFAGFDTDYACEFRTQKGEWNWIHMPNQPGYPKLYTSLETAISAIEQLHNERCAVRVESNASKVITDSGERNADTSLRRGTRTDVRASWHREAGAHPASESSPAGEQGTRRVARRVPRCPTGDVDRFGSPVGSSNAIVNAVLTEAPKTFNDLVKDSGLTRGQVRYAHLDALVKKGFLKKSAAGYALCEEKSSESGQAKTKGEASKKGTSAKKSNSASATTKGTPSGTMPAKKKQKPTGKPSKKER